MKGKRKKNWKIASKEDRLRELKRLFTTPENKLRPAEFKTFSDLHKRIEELVGRPVFTHEIAFPDLLYEEIKSGKLGNPLRESLVRATKLTKDKKAFIITPSVVEGMPLGFKVVGKLDLSKEKEES
ncbi:MAG: hypothetical protein E3J76_01585 [Candidatus Aminicenantes bacterium]|nr:MAG: hypothetical protein E3J76_01585 [Candidatus Aminicenantes bacterium]